MIETLLVVSTVLLILVLVLVLVVLLRKPKDDAFVELEKELALLQENAERLERSLREEFALSRNETTGNLSQQRQELTTTLSSVSEGVRSELDKIRETVEGRLEQMRATVDDKLHKTLEQRLGESFRQVSERLELVHKGLGEMQTLASGVGDLRKVLTNVKTRGMWGEIQLGNLLEQILSPEQYAKNVATKLGSNDRVEFAVKLPGREKEDEPVWLPLDAKFPQEDYQRLVDAAEQANAELVDEAGKMLEARIKKEAKTIKEKYLAPPHTTDFAILFLPTEGLYAEVTRRVGLLETLQREYRITVMGPTTVAAFLNSLQMGFRTLAIERRSSEVWSLLGAVKTEFSRFGEILEKTQKKLQEASNTIDVASRQSRAIERKLKDVQQLPPSDSAALLPEISPPDEPES
ncbi:DNA recombination protein RmuC [Sphingobacteriales bacterium CHB3]|nr:DNA recombination protein RmuC [Sphingobacteriales bacterium CHB3]